jgi:hypothetical protein
VTRREGPGPRGATTDNGRYAIALRRRGFNALDDGLRVFLVPQQTG